MDSDCEHKYVYGGIKFEIQDWKLPGSGAQPVHYFDWFFCEKCTIPKYVKIKMETSTYDQILFDATPK